MRYNDPSFFFTLGRFLCNIFNVNTLICLIVLWLIKQFKFVNLKVSAEGKDEVELEASTDVNVDNVESWSTVTYYYISTYGFTVVVLVGFVV